MLFLFRLKSSFRDEFQRAGSIRRRESDRESRPDRERPEFHVDIPERAEDEAREQAKLVAAHGRYFERQQKVTDLRKRLEQARIEQMGSSTATFHGESSGEWAERPLSTNPHWLLDMTNFFRLPEVFFLIRLKPAQTLFFFHRDRKTTSSSTIHKTSRRDKTRRHTIRIQVSRHHSCWHSNKVYHRPERFGAEEEESNREKEVYQT